MARAQRYRGRLRKSEPFNLQNAGIGATTVGNNRLSTNSIITIRAKSIVNQVKPKLIPAKLSVALHIQGYLS